MSATVYVQQAAPPGQRGPALSAYNAAFIGFVPAGAFAVAALAAVAGVALGAGRLGRARRRGRGRHPGRPPAGRAARAPAPG